jgi:hypothetical protein
LLAVTRGLLTLAAASLARPLGLEPRHAFVCSASSRTALVRPVPFGLAAIVLPRAAGAAAAEGQRKTRDRPS